jgi:hypothetical protein
MGLEYSNTGGWRFENWLADLILSCKAGYTSASYDDEQLRPVLYDRVRPIVAMISLVANIQ